MKIKLLSQWSTPDHNYSPGAIVEVEDALAKDLIDAHSAEEANELSKKIDWAMRKADDANKQAEAARNIVAEVSRFAAAEPLDVKKAERIERAAKKADEEARKKVDEAARKADEDARKAKDEADAKKLKDFDAAVKKVEDEARKKTEAEESRKKLLDLKQAEVETAAGVPSVETASKKG